MFTTNTSITPRFSVPYFACGDASLTIPVPEAVHSAGAPCLIAWNGDTNTSIVCLQPITSNHCYLSFFHILYLAITTNQDRIVRGQFAYTCYPVIPKPTIYSALLVHQTNVDLVSHNRFI